MASAVTTYGTSYFLGVMFGVNTTPSGFYLALCTDEPGVDTDGDLLADLEPDDTAYLRFGISAGTSDWGLAGNYLTNLNDLDFGTPGADWDVITHYALCDSATSGEVYAYGAFANAAYVEAGYDFVLPAGGIVVALSSLADSIAV